MPSLVGYAFEERNAEKPLNVHGLSNCGDDRIDRNQIVAGIDPAIFGLPLLGHSRY